MGLLFVQDEAAETKNTNSMRRPLLFFLGELAGETKHGFFDPINRTCNPVVIPELGFQLDCLSSRFGWLLLISRETSSFFFFNPITRQRIELPYRKSMCNAATFTAPPTSYDCVVFVVETPIQLYDARMNVATFQVGGKKPWWTNWGFNKSSNFDMAMQAVYSSGVVYCFDTLGRIGKFDPGDHTWSVVPTGPTYQKVRHSYLVESNGGIYAGKKGPYGVIKKLYKLEIELDMANWAEVKELEGVALYLGPYGSCSVTTNNLNEGMEEKKVIVAADRPESKCAIYDFEGGCCKKDTAFGEPNFGWWYNSVWIERSSS